MVDHLDREGDSGLIRKIVSRTLVHVSVVRGAALHDQFCAVQVAFLGASKVRRRQPRLADPDWCVPTYRRAIESD